MPEEDKGALEEAGEEADGAVVEAEFEVVEAAALEGAEVFVFNLCELVWLFVWLFGCLFGNWVRVREGRGIPFAAKRA